LVVFGDYWMEQKIGVSGAAFSLAALLSTGCVNQFYTQVQLGYATAHHKKDLGGHVDLMCAGIRGGAKVGEGKKQEARMGVDICHGKLPTTLSQKTYSIDVPVVGKQEADVYGATSSDLVKVSIPFVEYRYGALEANIPSEVPAELGIRSPHTKDVSLGMWAAVGYDLNFTVSETDYVTSGGALENIPGVDFEGELYGGLTNEVTFFGKIPVSMSIRVDKDADVASSFGAGYRQEW